jgi:adenylate cyclase
MPEHVFVARESEMQRLNTFLDKALERNLAGEIQLCFIAGDAGAGKSALVTEFARRAEAEHDKLLVAIGECNAQTGLSDSYLPFREILMQLTGDNDNTAATGKISQQNSQRLANFARNAGGILMDIAPDIIGTLIPGSGLIATIAKAGADRAGLLKGLETKPAEERVKLNEDMIFQQIANLLSALAKETPLVLILDDLQWADEGSIALLFHLSRVLKNAPLLIVGTYRPSDIALGRGGSRHPLEAALNEIKRYRGSIIIDLNDTDDVARRAFIDALIDCEPNNLGTDFRSALFDHTGGYPLFTVELLRNMQERGDLVWDETTVRWTQPGDIHWDELPTRVEGVIEERIGRLTENLRDILTTASVEGSEFTTQVIAGVREISERELMKSLSDELERRHRLVEEGAERKIGGKRLWHYRFGHVLFQKYLYDELSKGQRRLLHSDVARILESLYGAQTDNIAIQLAHHFDEAGEDEKAAQYFFIAGKQTAASYGNAEALRHFTRALELTPEEDAARRFEIYQARMDIYNDLGARQAQLAELEAMEHLAETLNDDFKRAVATICRANYYHVTSDYYPNGVETASKAIELGKLSGNIEAEARGHSILGAAHNVKTEFANAEKHQLESLAVARKAGIRRLEVDPLINLAINSAMQGQLNTALTYFEEALSVIRECGLRQKEASLLYNLSILQGDLGNDGEQKKYSLEGLQLVRQIGYRRFEGDLLNVLGIQSIVSGEFGQALDYFREGLPIATEIQDRRLQTHLFRSLSRVTMLLGQYSESRQYIDHAIAIAQEIKSTFLEYVAQIQKAWLHYVQEEFQSAYDVTLTAIQVNEGEDHPLRTFGHEYGLAFPLEGLGRLDDAAVSFQKALTIQQELNHLTGIADVRAGLARIALAKNDIAQAVSHIDAIWSLLESGQFKDSDEPAHIYLTAYRVLTANQDPRAAQVLQWGVDFLNTRADNLQDEELRRSYLENVVHNRDLITLSKGQRMPGI